MTEILKMANQINKDWSFFREQGGALEKMNFAPKNLFKNSNRKIIFFVIDPTLDPTLIHHRGYYLPIKIEGRENDYFDAGNGYYAQFIAFYKFIDILGNQESRKIL